MRRFAALRLLSLVLLAAPVAHGQAHYDEIYDSAGTPRPGYAGILDIVNSMTPEQERQFLNHSYIKFGRDNKLDRMPRVIPAAEYDRDIVRGVEQRARALTAFLQDHYSGQKTYRAFVSEATIDRIIGRNGELGYRGLITPDTIAFPYGPDIIRDGQGVWRVIEDNPGFIGGPGDLRLARELTLKGLPGFQAHINPRDPEDFYRKLAASYQERARAKGGRAILLMSPYKVDAEDLRIRQILHDYGIETVFPREGNDLAPLVKPDGLYIYRKSLGPSSAEKVGFAALMGEHSWFDPGHPAARERLVLEEAKSLLAQKDKPKFAVPVRLRQILDRLLREPRSGRQIDTMAEAIRRLYPRSDITRIDRLASPYKGILDLILQDKLASNYTPGAEFIGDKELYVYVEEFIRHYLKEQPILRNIDTRKFAGVDGRIDMQVTQEVFANFDQYVVKKVDGRGGDAVWVGPKVKDAAKMADVRRRVESDPDSYIVQKYTPLSKLRGLIVDMRVITDVYAAAKRIVVQVANTAWGRGLPESGNGKVNLSDQGREITILVDDGVPRQGPARGRSTSAGQACRDVFASGAGR